MTSSSTVDGYGSSSSEAAQAALFADMFTLKCETGFVVVGLVDGEAECTPIRVICTLVTMSVASAWFSRRKSIKKLLLFFSHWLSGMLYQLALMVEATMILICWTGDNLVGFLKALKFVELTSSNMLAVTNLVICVNLARIVMSHRTLSAVKSANSGVLMLLSLVVSMGAAAASLPFWDTTIVTGSTFWPFNDSERAQDWITISIFYVELFVGVCMFIIVTWLLLFWMKEIKECWKVHVRIRYYFGLTLIGTAVNLALGICGTIYVVGGREKVRLIVLTWAFRYIHIALDTFVLYGVLGAGNMNERASSTSISGGGLEAGRPVGSRAPKGHGDVSRKSSSKPPVSPQNSVMRLPQRL